MAGAEGLDAVPDVELKKTSAKVENGFRVVDFTLTATVAVRRPRPRRPPARGAAAPAKKG